MSSAPPPAAAAVARPPGALVLGGDYRGLGVVRSLGRRRVPVAVLHQADEPLAGLSRFSAFHSRAVDGPLGG